MLDLTDVSDRLARFRFRIQEFDFEICFRKGAKHSIADAVSRLHTWGHSTADPDLDIPCFFVISGSIAPVIPRQSRIDSDSWTTADWDPDSDTILAIKEDEAAKISANTVNELLASQAQDPSCRSVCAKIIDNDKARDFAEDPRGPLLRISPIDGAVRILVPADFRTKVLLLAHRTPTADHPGATKR